MFFLKIKNLYESFDIQCVLKSSIFRLNLLFNFAIIPLIGNNFKTKIFFLLKQIYGGLSQDSIWKLEILQSGYRSQPV